MGERTRRPMKTTATEFQFADDAALVGSSRKDVESRITSASRAFGALCRPVFQDKGLTLKTKRIAWSIML